MKLTGSQIFVEVLVEQGVDTLFGYPGGAVLNLYDELYKNSDRIRHVLTAQGILTIDANKTRPGRGWYLCSDAACMARFAKFRPGARRKGGKHV